MPNVKLQSSDGNVFDIDVEIAKCSFIIKKKLEDFDMDKDEENVVSLNVNAAILKKIIQWATYHKDDLSPLDSDISSWDADFLQGCQNEGIFYNLLLAAYKLDIKRLLYISYKTIAQMIHGKSPEELREIFNLTNDFTIEEQEELAYEWNDLIENSK